MSTENDSELPVLAGQVLDGKFRVERIIGEGAMGLVVEAYHLDLDERVALKFLRREARERPDIVTRFAREARAAAKIASDHVARVYDVGGTNGPSPFIVMEFLEGMDLDAVLAKDGPLKIPDAVELVIQACEGLTAAHSIGVIHRDMKPANLFRTERAGACEVKIVDFGISKASVTGTFEDIDLASAQTTQIMGSPHYMSPEQIRSTKDVDARADIWSLGVVLYELLTGQTPFTATEVTGIIAQVLHDAPRSVRSLRPEIPPELEAVIDRCLQKDPARRFDSAAELAVALLPFAPKRARAVVERAIGMRSRASGLSLPVDSLPPPAPSTSRGPTPEGSRSTTGVAVSTARPLPARRSPVLWIALAVVLLGIVGAVVVLRPRAAPEPPRSEASAAVPKATETVAAPVLPASTPAPVASAPVVAASATTTTTTPATTQAPAAPAPRPVAKPKPKPDAPPAESDIRRER